MSLTIRQWRRLKEMSQKNLADACGVHENTIRNWEEDSSQIKLSDAIKLSEVFGVSIDDIVFTPTKQQNVE